MEFQLGDRQTARHYDFMELRLHLFEAKKQCLYFIKKNIYRATQATGLWWRWNVLVKFILSDINIEAESELLILHHGIGRHHSGVTAFMSRGGGQLVVMIQKLLKGPQISSCVSIDSQPLWDTR